MMLSQYAAPARAGPAVLYTEPKPPKEASWEVMVPQKCSFWSHLGICTPQVSFEYLHVDLEGNWLNPI